MFYHDKARPHIEKITPRKIEELGGRKFLIHFILPTSLLQTMACFVVYRINYRNNSQAMKGSKLTLQSSSLQNQEFHNDGINKLVNRWKEVRKCTLMIKYNIWLLVFFIQIWTELMGRPDR